MTDRIDMHTHTLASGHAYSTITEMARAAADKGLEALGITEHAPAMTGSCSWLYFANLRVLPSEMFGVKMLYGVELNILGADGRIDMEPYQMRDVSYAIASIHSALFPDATTDEYTEAYIRAMDHPKVSIIGHPDDERALADYDLLVRAAAEKHVLLEVNNSSLHPTSFRKGARENLLAMLALCRKIGASVIVDSDAHYQNAVGNHDFAHALLSEISFPEDLIVNRSLDAFLRFTSQKTQC